MIRRLTDTKHIQRLVEYGRAWHKKSAHAAIPFSPERCKQTLKGAMLSPGCAVFAAFDRERLCGVLIGVICEYQWFDESYATDLIFIADKYGDRLFSAFVKWAMKHTNTLQMGVTSGLPQAEAFYAGIGMQRIGGIYYQRIEK